jgi:hypothetical protein
VVGVLAGIIILLLICCFCVLKASVDTVLGLFGLGKRKERVTVTEDRYSRHSGRQQHTGWFSGGGRTEKRTSNTKERGILAVIALGLAGLWAALSFKRKNKPKPPPSYASYGTYSDTYSGDSRSKSSTLSSKCLANQFNHR